MGSCLSLDQEELKARARSDHIDKQLQSWAKEEENCIKILLLGKSPINLDQKIIEPRHVISSNVAF